MTPTFPGGTDEFAPEPEDWQDPVPTELSPEALANEPDEVAAALPPVLPLEADEADALDQQREALVADDDDDDEDDLAGFDRG